MTAGRLIREDSLTSQKEAVVEFSLFDDFEAKAKQEEADQRAEAREKALQHAMLAIKHKFDNLPLRRPDRLRGSRGTDGQRT